MAAIPPEVEKRLGPAAFGPDPWLPFDWPVQVRSWGPSFGRADAPEVEWARGILQLRLPHPPVPLAHPQDPTSQDPDITTFCWSLNQVVQAAKADQKLAEAGYDLAASKATAVNQLSHVSLPEYACVLVVLELLYRQISIEQQNQLRSACGEDVMRAAYQMNRVCIDPDDDDRTLLQVQRIGLKLCGEAEPRVRAGIQILLSDGRTL